jgi:hypothetical protein
MRPDLLEHFAERLRLHAKEHNVGLRYSFAIVGRHPDAKTLTESSRFIAVQYRCAHALWRKQFLLKIRAKKNATEFPGAEDG